MSESVKNSDFGITLLPSSFSLNENWPTLERGPTNEIEELTVRIETKKRILNIITLYGKTENNKNEIIREQFTHLENIIENIEKEGEDYILIGDLNAKIGREKIE